MIVILLGCSFASAENSQISKLALDMVVIIDESASMSVASNSLNDEYGYRHDAAAALIGLCDANDSRVALLPFASGIITSVPGVNELKDIDIKNNGEVRRNLLNLLYNERDRSNPNANLYTYSIEQGGETDMGSALERAVEMLLENPGSNRPVIVLLSDGEISFRNNDQQKKTESQNKFNNALELAKKNLITIYSVALKLDSKNLSKAAKETNGKYYTINSPEDLPNIFNGIFADLVGSDVVTLKSENVATGNNQYLTTFKVPNLSIAEANILLPVGQEGEINVYKPGSTQAMNFNDTTCLRYSTKYFTLIKILNPDKIGEWSIQYTQSTVLNAKQRDALGRVSINVIFSYNVIPNIVASSDPLHKKDETRLDMFFVKPNGENSTDSALYMGGINATLQIIDANGDAKIITSPNGESETEIQMIGMDDRFTTSFVLKDLFPDIKGGDYSFRITLKGDGMDDETVLDSKVENLAPVLTGTGNNPFADKTIHDPTRQDYENEIEQVIDLNQFVSEPDAERVNFKWLDPAGDSILDMVNLKDGILTMKTKNASGKETLKIRAFDDEEAEITIEIPCEVTVARDVIRDHYSLVITNNGAEAEKGTSFTYTAKLMNDDQQVMDNELLNLLNLNSLKLVKTYAAEGIDTETAPLGLTRSGNEFTAVAQISVNEATYSVEGDITLRDIPVKIVAPSFGRGNNAPVLTEGTENPFQNTRIHDPLTEDYAEEKTCVLNLNDFASDPDHEELAFTLVTNEEEQEIVSKTLDGSKLTLQTMDLGGDETITVNAADPEGAYIAIVLPVHIDNIRTQMRENYAVEVILPDQIEKNSATEVQVYLKNNEETITDEALLAAVDTSALALSFKKESGGEEPVEIDWNLKGDKWTATTQSSAYSGSYKASGTVSLQNGDIELPVKKTTGGFVGNIAPTIDEEYQAGIQHRFEIEPFLWRKLDENAVEIDLNQLFIDSVTDVKNVGAIEIPSELKEEEVNLTDTDWFARRDEFENIADTASKVLKLTNDKAGIRKILLFDVDSDDQSVYWIYEQEIISQKNEVIILILEVLAGIVALIILIILWYWLIHRKAWTKKHGSVAISVNHVPRPVKNSFPARGKADVSLGYLKIAEVGSGELNTQLSAYTRMFKLRAGANTKVYILRQKSKDAPFSMQVGMKAMNRNTKKVTWEAGEVMTIKTVSTNTQYGNVQIDIKRETGMDAGASGVARPVAGRTAPLAPQQNPAGGGISRPKI